MPMNQRTMRPRASSVTYHAEALAWKTAAEANGGTVSTPTLAAVSTFCTAIDAASIRDRFLRLNLFCGGNLSAARTPLYRGASLTGDKYGMEIDDNIGPFIDDDYSQTTGLNGNGTTKFLDTGIDLPACYAFGMEYNNVHLMAYRQESIGWEFIQPIMGGSVAGAFTGLAMFHSATEIDVFSGDFEENYIVVGSAAADPGMYLAQIDSTPDGVLLRNDVTVKTSQNLVSAQSFNATNTDILVFTAANGLGGFDTPIATRLSGYSFGKAFTSSAQRTAFYNAMQAFRTALGRTV